MIIATPIVPNQYWILKQDNTKIGNIQASPEGYTVKILDQIGVVKTIPMLKNIANIKFEALETVTPLDPKQVHGYQTGCAAFNGMWNVQLKLPLFTKEEKSKSWYAGGWYSIKQHRTWKLVRNPKLISLERYKYQGPFYTKEEANDKSI